MAGDDIADLAPLIESRWDTVPLGNVTVFVNGDRGKNYPSQSDYVSRGIPFISAADLVDGRVDAGNCTFITEAAFDRLGSGKTKEGDLLFCLRGSLGKVARVRSIPRGAIASSLVIIRATDQTDKDYLYYILSGPLGQRLAAELNNGSVQPNISARSLKESFIQFPPLAEQKAIAAVLGALDDKIELNRRMNETLEAMARALFQSWFIDFDPVRRNMDRGQSRPSPQPSPTGRGRSAAEGKGASGLDFDLVSAKLDGRPPAAPDEATTALFPASFQDSELGHIPRGWIIQPVGEVVDCVGGGTPSTAEPKYWEGGTHHWTTPKDFSSLQAPVLLDTDRKLTDAGIAKISSGLLPAGTLLLSSRAPVGYLAIAAMPVAINQGFIALKCNERASNFFMLNWCQTNMAEIESRATGTTFAEISKQNFRPIPVVLPPQDIMAVFTAKVAPLYVQIAANLHQSRTLATLRDTLLPKLLSGAFSVEALESSLETTP